MKDQIAQIADRFAITDVLSRYCRGVDRMDLPLTRSCWHADGTANYIEMFEGDADGLLAWMWKLHGRMQTHSHQIGNMLIELDGDRARSETYVSVILRMQDGDDLIDLITRARYADRFSRRDGVWALDHRICIADLGNRFAVEAAGIPVSGRRDPEDPSYAVLTGASTE